MPALKNHKHELCAMAMAGGAQTQKEAMRAGGLKYDTASASRLFNRPEVKARISEIIAERAQTERQIALQAVAEAAIDRAWVLRHLKHNALAAMRGHPLYTRDGDYLRDKFGNQRYGKPDHTAAAVSLKLIGHDLGMFIQRTEVGAPGDFARMSDHELKQELASLVEAMGLPAETLAVLTDQTEEDEDA
jgi:hypothetical protein